MGSGVPGDPKGYPSTITKAELTSRDGSGDPSFGAQTTQRARVERYNKKILDEDGNEVQANHKVFSPVVIDWSDRLWIPGDSVVDVLAGRRIIDLSAVPTLDGSATLYVATIGWPARLR